jgi:hypothetical protein
MERLEPYKGFQIRAYQEWSGQWLAEARKAGINRPDADYIATPSDHPTPEAAINFIKQMIDQQMIDKDALARLTKRKGKEIIETLYGINPNTFEVETVSLNRGGELRKTGKDVELRTHYVAPGRDPKSEVRITFGLTNVFSVPQALVDQRLSGADPRVALVFHERLASSIISTFDSTHLTTAKNQKLGDTDE